MISIPASRFSFPKVLSLVSLMINTIFPVYAVFLIYQNVKLEYSR